MMRLEDLAHAAVGHEPLDAVLALEQRAALHADPSKRLFFGRHDLETAMLPRRGPDP